MRVFGVEHRRGQCAALCLDVVLAGVEIVRERARAAYAETIEATVRIQVFGRPTEAILETLRQHAGSGAEISVNGEHLSGFTRSAAEL